MRFLMFIIAALLFGFKSVYASPIEKIKKEKLACYGREYSENHLQKHPLQKTKQIRVKMYDTPENVILMDVNLILKKQIQGKDGLIYEKNKSYTSSLYCLEISKNQIRCSIECDGGSATVKWTKKSKDTVHFINNGFLIYGGCGEEVEPEWFENTPKGDDIFKLYSLPKEFCGSI